MTDDEWFTLSSVDRYKTTKDKLQLVMESTCMAKCLLVEEQGIGEDLPSTLVGWESDRFAVLVQAEPRIMKLSREKRLNTLEKVSEYLRNGWQTTSFTFISEGFCNTGQNEETRPLDEAFINNPDVLECITFVHVTPTSAIVVAAPYKQKLGRIVEFQQVSTANSGSFNEQTNPLQRILNKPIDLLKTKQTDLIVDDILQQGWQVVHDIWDEEPEY